MCVDVRRSEPFSPAEKRGRGRDEVGRPRGTPGPRAGPARRGNLLLEPPGGEEVPVCARRRVPPRDAPAPRPGAARGPTRGAAPARGRGPGRAPGATPVRVHGEESVKVVVALELPLRVVVKRRLARLRRAPAVDGPRLALSFVFIQTPGDEKEPRAKKERAGEPAGDNARAGQGGGGLYV